jgi:hypothetical protein
MKNTFKFLLLGVTVMASSCINHPSDTPVPIPIGTFSGQFTSFHLKSSGHIDTLKANITLTTTNNSLFKVTGDTSAVHAGSHGGFQLNTAYIQFQDSTVNYTVNALFLQKAHLNGLYQYAYDGSNLQIGASNDTLKYIYNLKRTQ